MVCRTGPDTPVFIKLQLPAPPLFQFRCIVLFPLLTQPRHFDRKIGGQLAQEISHPHILTRVR